ncbi:MAG: oligopeptide/dipeptide ABC transporter ATP-binding protein [Anaerolineae bacterium]
MTQPLLQVRGLKLYFPVKGGLLRRTTGYVKAVDSIDLDILPGEVVGLAGESGSGKTTVGRAILRLIEPTAGQVLFNGQDLAALDERSLRRTREQMQIVFQNPYSALDPRMTVRDLIMEPLDVHDVGEPTLRERRVRELAKLVGLSLDTLDRYPHEFSGGQRQRIGIARALALNPQLLILDEPTSALDVSVQATILNLLLKLRDELNLSYLFISHDLSVLRYICDRIGVMYLGRIVELATTNEIFERPQHPYTISLLSAAPKPALEQNADEIILEGEVSQQAIGKGCRFNPRCPAAQIELCTEIEPTLDEVWPGHRAACHLALEGLPLNIQAGVTPKQNAESLNRRDAENGGAQRAVPLQPTAPSQSQSQSTQAQKAMTITSKPMSGYRIATDIGGTFTDMVYLDERTGQVKVTKASTTPHNFAQGVLDTLDKAQDLNTAQTSFFVHGTTVVINALTERKGVKTGLITTKGFRDVLEIGRSNRPDLYNMYYQKPVPFVPRHLRYEVTERVNYKGEVLEALNVNELRDAVRQLVSEGVASIAVCFLHSYANPEHEMLAGRVLREVAPHIPFTLSHDVTQEWREFERTSTAVLNSYVLPTARAYLENLEQNLTTRKRMGDVLHIMQSNGGSATFDMGKQTPINLVESGPVAGVIGAARVGELIGEHNIIAFDVGGTTAKTSLVEHGKPKITTEYKIELTRETAGYPILAPTVDIVEIGSGGGSIAHVDGAGALKVGPVSAGAVPGPACYDKGGTQPTVTDANLLTGRLNPDYFLGGELKVNVKRAVEAMTPIAQHFNMSIEEAALGVVRISDFGKINAIKLISVRRGYDPRDFVVVAFGGGGPMHAAAMMRDLRCKKVVIPTHPGVFSAFGMLMTDLRIDYIRTLISRTDQIDITRFNQIYEEMEQQARARLSEENVAAANIQVQRYADMRYHGQEHTVKVPLPAGKVTQEALARINDSFHDLHEQAYTFRLNTSIELVNYHLTAIGLVAKAEIGTVSNQGTGLARAKKGTRQVLFEDFGKVNTTIYEREYLPVDKIIEGPVIIEEPASVTVVYPDQQVYRDKYGFLHIEMQNKKSRFGLG